MNKLINRLRVKKTSWAFVALHPNRWIELVRYVLNSFRGPVTGTDDRPDPRDVSAKIKGSRLAKLPAEFYLDDKAEELGWKSKKQSKNSCSAYSKGNGVEITNTVLNQKPCYIDKEEQWSYQCATGGSVAKGDWIQNAEKQFHAHPQKYPQTGYGRLRSQDNSIYGVKRALISNETVRTVIYWKWVTAEKNTNSGILKKTGEFIPGNGKVLGGHALIYCGWNDNRINLDGTKGAFRFKESEEMKCGDNPRGKLWVSYSNFDRIRSKYVSMDALDVI